MYLRHTTRRKDGKVHRYWRLVRSVRVGRKVIQQTVAHLGELDAEGRARAKALARAITGNREQPDLFEPTDADETIPVRLKRIRLERGRTFGDVWLGWTLWRALRLDEAVARLLPEGREAVPWATMAAVLVLARLCEPSSELHIAETWYRGTALEDLLALPAPRVNDDRLYRALDRLVPHKTALEQHLVERLGELFALDYDLLLYDVTSVYFEGLAEANPLAQRGHSRDHRADCKQVCLALVVTRDGMPLGYEDGLGRLGQRMGRARRPLDVRRLERQLGRLLERNQRAAGRYVVEFVPDPTRAASVRLAWSARPEWDDWARWSEGCYVLRTNVTDWSPDELWRTYIQLTDAEAAFRIQKSELGIRPVWHQRADRVQAHILVCFLAYVLWKTLEQWQRRARLGQSPRTIFDELRRIQSTDIVLPTEDGPELRLRRVVPPDAAQAAALDRLGLDLPHRLRVPPPVTQIAEV